MGKLSFDEYAEEYDAWFMQNPNVLASEVLLLKRSLGSPGKTLSVGSGTGLFEHFLRTQHGIEVAYGSTDVGEALVVPVIKAVKDQARNSNGATVIVDSPPGVACPMVESVHGSDYCLLVTEPTPFGVHDLQLAVDTVRQLGIPIGVVVNRSGIGNRQVYAYCKAERLPILLEIPHSRKIAELFSEGIPFVTEMSEWKSKFQTLFHIVQGEVLG